MKTYDDPKVIEAVTDILLKIGYIFQINDDYSDAFSQNTLHKTNNDIQQGKCTWFICKALEISTVEIKTVIMENYGKPEKSCADTVVSNYISLGLLNEYQDFKRTEFTNLMTEINGNSIIFDENLKNFLIWICNAVFKVQDVGDVNIEKVNCKK